MQEAGSGTTPMERLAALLDVAAEGGDRFRGEPGRDRGRLFGGLVAAQALVAAGRSVARGAPHSLHAYFLRPGSATEPVRYAVERMRDGRTFAARRVTASQSGGAILTLAASFAPPEPGLAHQEPAPEAPPPETLRDWELVRAELLGEAPRPRGPIELRACDPDAPQGGVVLPPRKRTWIRPRGPLPEDPLLHAAALVYASDRGLLSTASRPHALPWSRRRAASLDHAVWLHRPVRFEGWLLYASESPVAFAARGLSLGAFYDREGRRVASVAQEGLVRERREEPGAGAGARGPSRRRPGLLLLRAGRAAGAGRRRGGRHGRPGADGSRGHPAAQGALLPADGHAAVGRVAELLRRGRDGHLRGGPAREEKRADGGEPLRAEGRGRRRARAPQRRRLRAPGLHARARAHGPRLRARALVDVRLRAAADLPLPGLGALPRGVREEERRVAHPEDPPDAPAHRGGRAVRRAAPARRAAAGRARRREERA